jgi:hypothetical protein
MKSLSKSKKQPDVQKKSGILPQPDNFGIKKKYLKTKPICKVKFTLPKDNGNYTITLDLEKGEYCFRYLIDGSKWENDWHADKYVPNSFGCDNSVVVL